MNATLKHMLETQTPRGTYTDTQIQYYKNCLSLFASVLGEDFLDIPVLDPTNPTDGLFYQIPFLHSDIADRDSKSHDLLTVHRVNGQSNTCQLCISLEFTAKRAFRFVVIDHHSRSRKKYVVATVNEHKKVTIDPDFQTVPLSEWSTG